MYKTNLFKATIDGEVTQVRVRLEVAGDDYTDPIDLAAPNLFSLDIANHDPDTCPYIDTVTGVEYPTYGEDIKPLTGHFKFRYVYVFGHDYTELIEQYQRAMKYEDADVNSFKFCVDVLRDGEFIELGWEWSDPFFLDEMTPEEAHKELIGFMDYDFSEYGTLLDDIDTLVLEQE